MLCLPPLPWSLFVIGDFLTSPFKMFNYLFLHVLQGSILVEKFLKINLQLILQVECKNNTFDNPNILKQKLSHRAEENCRKVRSAGRSWDAAALTVLCTFQAEFSKCTLAQGLPNKVNFVCFGFSVHLSLFTQFWWGREVPLCICVYISLYTYVRLSLAHHYKRLGKILLPTELKIK